MNQKGFVSACAALAQNKLLLINVFSPISREYLLKVSDTDSECKHYLKKKKKHPDFSVQKQLALVPLHCG